MKPNGIVYRLIGIAALIVMLMASTTAYGQLRIDPSFKWQTIETPHFRITYHQGLEGPAQEIASQVEGFHDALKEEFGRAPEKTEIVLVDPLDLSNGSTDPVSGEIMIFAYQGRLSDHFNVRLDSWWQMVLFHEHLHAVDLDQTRGISQALRLIFGTIVLPEIHKPIPFIEGLAVYEKYKHLGESRVNDSQTEMMLRQMVLDNALPPYDQITSYYGRTEWPPVGQLVYNYGSWLDRYIEERYGSDKMAKIDQINAAKPLNLLAPFFIYGQDFDDVLKEALGVSRDQLYQDFKSWLRERFTKQIQDIASQGVTPAIRVGSLGYMSDQPAWAQTGSAQAQNWIAYRHSDPSGRDDIRLITPEGDQDHELVNGSVSLPAWSPDGQKLVYAKIDFDGPFYALSDLYLYDLQAQQEKRLTWGARAYYAQFAPDGQSIYLAQTVSHDGSTALSKLDLATNQIRVLKSFPEDDGIIHSFALSPDGSQLALSLWRRGGYQDIYLMPASGGDLAPVTQDKAQDADPVWSRNGDFVLFSSDHDRVYNIYAYRVSDGAFFKATNTLTGAFHPTLSPDGQWLAFTGYSSAGYDIYKMPYQPSAWKPVQFAMEKIPAWSGYPKTNFPVKPYDPTLSLAPKLWLPLPVPGGAGIVTEGRDATLQQAYSALLGYDFKKGQPIYNLTYANLQLFPSLTVNLAGDSAGNSQALSASFPLVLHLNESQTLTVGYKHSRRTSEVQTSPMEFAGLLGQTEANGPKGTRDTFTASWSLERLSRQNLYANAFAVSLDSKLETIEGSGVWQKSFVLDWRESWRLPVETTQRISLRFVGGWSDVRDVEQEGFKVGGPYGRFALRGFKADAFKGKLALVGSLQYGFPLLDIEQGVGRFSLFLSGLHGRLFVDGGMAGDRLSLNQLKVGFGTELLLDATLSFFARVTLGVGAAQGVGEAGPVFYLTTDLPF
jgi:hypothetical protein